MAVSDTLKGLYHLFTDRKPGELESRPPKPRRTAVWLKDGRPLVSKVPASEDVKPAVEECLDLLGPAGRPGAAEGRRGRDRRRRELRWPLEAYGQHGGQAGGAGAASADGHRIRLL